MMTLIFDGLGLASLGINIYLMIGTYPRRNLVMIAPKKSYHIDLYLYDDINIRRRPLRSPRRFAPGLASLGIKVWRVAQT